MLELACWSDQILTLIIFQSHLKIGAKCVLEGTILISVYRRQDEKTNVIYDKLRQIIRKIKDRYEQVKIVIGGDFNDSSPPKDLLGIK